MGSDGGDSGQHDLPDLVREALGDEADGMRDLLAELGAASVSSVRPTGRARLFAALEQTPTRYAPFYDRLSELFDIDEQSVTKILSKLDAADRWTELYPGVRTLGVRPGPKRAGAQCVLLWHDPGAPFPMHQHRGEEHALLIEGALIQDDGKRYSAGDHEVYPAGSAHSYRVTDESRCVAAVALYDGLDIVEQ